MNTRHRSRDDILLGEAVYDELVKELEPLGFTVGVKRFAMFGVEITVRKRPLLSVFNVSYEANSDHINVTANTLTLREHLFDVTLDLNDPSVDPVQDIKKLVLNTVATEENIKKCP